MVKAPTAIDAIPAAIRADMVSDINICPADTLLYTIASFINFPSLIVKCHPSITQKPFYNIISGHKYNSNIVKIPMTEKVAIKVEDNIKTLNLIVEFKLQQVKGPRLLQGISTKFFIVDKATNEIYFSL